MFILLGIIAFIVAFIVLSLHPAERSYDMPKFRVCGKSFLSLLALLLCLVNGVKSIPTGHTGVVATFGKVEDFTLEAGIHFINPLSRVVKIDNRTQKETVEFSAFSSDIQEVEVVYTLNYSIDKANAQNLYRTVGLNYYETVIQPKVIENVKKVMAQYTAEKLVSSRSEVAQNIEKELTVDLDK